LLYKNIDSVKWNFGDEQSGQNNYSTNLKPQHTYPGPGTYAAKAVIYTRCKRDTVIANVIVEDISTVHLPGYLKDTITCKGQNFSYDATTPNATGYKWSTGTIYPEYKITIPGPYSVTAYNSCSVDTKTFNVAIQTCSCEIYVPTAFTPNGDFLNDRFRPVMQCYTLNYIFLIYNRFGGIVFKSSNPNDSWNGKINDYPANRGTYIWKVIYENPNDKRMYQKKGTVVLVR
jgi:gliding motility-associated-like protein